MKQQFGINVLELEVNARPTEGKNRVHVQWRTKGQTGYDKADITVKPAVFKAISRAVKRSKSSRASFYGSSTRYAKYDTTFTI